MFIPQAELFVLGNDHLRSWLHELTSIPLQCGHCIKKWDSLYFSAFMAKVPVVPVNLLMCNQVFNTTLELWVGLKALFSCCWPFAGSQISAFAAALHTRVSTAALVLSCCVLLVPCVFIFLTAYWLGSSSCRTDTEGRGFNPMPVPDWALTNCSVWRMLVLCSSNQ